MIDEIDSKALLWEHFNINKSSLEGNDIHLFRIETELYFERIKNNYPTTLSNKELLKSSRFKQLQHSKNYISRKYFLRLLLSKSLLVDPSTINYETIGNKKPYVKGLEFNTTHSGNLAFVALSDQPIGIDSELKKDHFDYEPLLAHCFNEAEISFVKQGDMKSNFYTLWTRKEAILKATAEGLVDDLREVGCLDNIVYRKGKQLHMHTIAVGESHVLSIACGSPSSRIKFWIL